MARRDGAIRRESLTPTRNLRRNSRDDGAHRTPSTRHTSRRALKDLSQLHRTTARATPHPRSSPCRRRKPHKNLPANRHARHRGLAILARHPRPHIIRTPRNRPPLPHPQLLVDLARPRIPTAQSRQHHRGAHARTVVIQAHRAPSCCTKLGQASQGLPVQRINPTHLRGRHFLPTQSALIPRCRSGSRCAIAALACHGETDLGQALFCGCGMEGAFFGLWVRFVIR